MSDEPVEVSVESKVKLLTDWIEVIQTDVGTMNAARDSAFAEYTKLKTTTDAWLASRMRKVNKIDKRINERKKAIKEIEREIEEIRSRPAPGILPPLAPKVRKVVTKTEIPPDTVSVFTDAERAAMNAEAHGTSQ